MLQLLKLHALLAPSLPFPSSFSVLAALQLTLTLVLVVTLSATTMTTAAAADPDTSCSDYYRHHPTKMDCVGSHDHFGRPCVYCYDEEDLNGRHRQRALGGGGAGGNNDDDVDVFLADALLLSSSSSSCYNVDQARWAKFFGEHCEDQRGTLEEDVASASSLGVS